ncbi:hydroperoxy fatty acid reductase gpx1 [Kordia sp. SMS9]|uniref:glutathione peroxidase n=1 Tax=Kordia sp. SMS9 TaxID=2282170 RepID=UPI000E0D361E|nr:glutathione peroxidase [Kordia sp. SMS9]AXG67964.1 hydroperoxy fatty acid reductase gpx1 [Kordia sp. SMS9]
MKTIEKAKLSTNVSANTEKQSIYDIEINDLHGNPMLLSDFKGKKILFVNVASKCGFTKQYKELQELSDSYKDQLVVIGSPCNQFGRQEPGDASQIQEFCQINFGVTFPLTEKLDVKGKNQHPLYKWLTSKELNGKKRSSVKWNFQKYLIDENGQFVNYYYSLTKPMSSKIRKHL